MSFKAKDLHYDTSNEPAFLRRLRAENSGLDGRHKRPVARSKRLRNDDEDDEPTYVAEDGNETLSKADYAALVSEADAKDIGDEVPKAEGAASSAQAPDVVDGGSAKPAKAAEAGIGPKKRKVAKVVADEAATTDEDGEGDLAAAAPKTKKSKKKAKATTLSFVDDGE